MTVQVIWKVLAWVVTFQLPQQTVIQIASQGVFTRCSSFQISHLIVTVKFTPFWGYLQLAHPVTFEKIKCYSHFQIITWIKSWIFLYSLLLNVLLINSKWYWRKMKKVLETFYMKWIFVMNVSCDGNQNICEAIITMTSPCKQPTMKHDRNKFNLTQFQCDFFFDDVYFFLWTSIFRIYPLPADILEESIPQW